MRLLGEYALLLAFLCSLYALVTAIFANGRYRQYDRVRGAVIASAVAMTTAVLVLEALFMQGDFAVRAVYNHTDRSMPLLYKMTALWGGDSGSVLFWGWILSLFMAYLAGRQWRHERRLTPMVIAQLSGLLVFFAGMSLAVVDPFSPVQAALDNGQGLDPLLQNPIMVIHPPVMYTGLIGLAVPAAYLLSGLWNQIEWEQWVPIVRQWLLLSWMLLGLALVLGGLWAYTELGWGGYWEWDPVENAALLPWLAATAFLHALQLERRRGTYRGWTVGLGLSSYLLTLVATYITRSGVLKNSVHSFTGTGVGPYFVGLFWASVLFMVLVLWPRRLMIGDRIPPRSYFSRESLYVFMESTLASMTLIVLLGTFYPVISKAFWHQTVVLNESYFNATAAPLFLLLVVLMSVMPALRWGPLALKPLLRRMVWPTMLGAGVAIGIMMRGYHQVMPIVGMSLLAVAVASMMLEYVLAAGTLVQGRERSWTRSLWRVVNGDRHRYGGYLSHLGFLLIAMGVVASHTNPGAWRMQIAVGQGALSHGYHLHFAGFQNSLSHGVMTAKAVLDVSQGTHHWLSEPGLSFFSNSPGPVARVSIHQGLMQNVYIVLQAIAPGGRQATFHIMVNSMVSWIWLGMVVLLIGSVWAWSDAWRRPLARRRGGRLAIAKERPTSSERIP